MVHNAAAEQRGTRDTELAIILFYTVTAANYEYSEIVRDEILCRLYLQWGPGHQQPNGAPR